MVYFCFIVITTCYRSIIQCREHIASYVAYLCSIVAKAFQHILHRMKIYLLQSAPYSLYLSYKTLYEVVHRFVGGWYKILQEGHTKFCSRLIYLVFRKSLVASFSPITLRNNNGKMSVT